MIEDSLLTADTSWHEAVQEQFRAFRVYWNVYRFCLGIETTREAVSGYQGQFAAAFAEFKRCSDMLGANCQASVISAQLRTLHDDIQALKRQMHAGDGLVRISLIRRNLQSGRLGAEVEKSLLDYYLDKESKGTDDRDKIDYLITSYFQHQLNSLLNPDSLPELEKKLASLLPAGSVLDGLVAPELMEQFVSLMRAIQKITGLNDFVASEIFPKIRAYKQSLNNLFFHPVFLARVILLNLGAREKFDFYLQEENQRSEEQIIKLAEVGGDIVVENTSGLAGLTLLTAKDLRKSLTQSLQEEYGNSIEKLSELDLLRNTVELSVSFYGLSAENAGLGATLARKIDHCREEDDLRSAIADLGMMVWTHAVKGSAITRFEYRGSPVTMTSWETVAYNEKPLCSEFHTKIHHAVRRTVGLIFVIQQNTAMLKKDGVAQRSLLALDYYMLKGQEMQSTLKDLISECISQCLKIEGYHLSNTLTRLCAAMALAKPVFMQSRANRLGQNNAPGINVGGGLLRTDGTGRDAHRFAARPMLLVRPL